ncbi:hypothetical protein Dsin_012845 [Dipteronia sinensis]|uniref:MULE transposase domain-containing protein n=1 Tax=Dipteronia sinensis TaxID=43782 RepID=A0AAE0E9U6_9ROSI|nr:hypothetical protein Dsin_012845 [Dipteronia sinensis]
MDVCRVIIRFNGYWEDDKYVSGESRGLVVLKGLTYHDLVSLLKMNIIANVDVTFALMEDRCTFVMYVTSGAKHNMLGQVDGMQHMFSLKYPTHTSTSCSNQVYGSVSIIQQPKCPPTVPLSRSHTGVPREFGTSGYPTSDEEHMIHVYDSPTLDDGDNNTGDEVDPRDHVETELFQLMPSYLYMLEQANPGTVTKVETNSENKFMYCFMCLGACIEGFRKAIRSVIAIDGTHLKGSYMGVVFVAAYKDGNNKIFHLAFGIGDKENEESWMWFLTELHKAIGHPDNLMFISDQNPSITNMFQKRSLMHLMACVFFPYTQNLKCNYKKTFTKDIYDIFIAAAYTYRQSNYDKEMNELLIVHQKVHQYVLEIGPENGRMLTAQKNASI